MPNIVNISRKFVDDHRAWHDSRGRHGHQDQEFLDWHVRFIEEFREWSITFSSDDREALTEATAPWTEVPAEVRAAGAWTADADADLAGIGEAIENSTTLDALAGFITRNIHGELHQAAAEAYREPLLDSYESPRSTYFWCLHGLIDSWRAQWASGQSGAQ